MENKLFKAFVLKNKQRGRGVLLFVCLLLFAITPGSAQSQNLKRITALQFGETVDGSRVTIVSDSALTDYEAFRRGDRFYVKFPLAEFKSVSPRCCASGFDGVNVQKVGESLIISFRLTPGATARVDQRSNRLDVIFSAPNRSFGRNLADASSSRGAPAPRLGSSTLRGPDAAGPMPPGTIVPFRQRALTEGERVANESRIPQSPRLPSNARTNSSKGANNQPVSGSNQPADGNNQSGSGKGQSTTGYPLGGSASPGTSPSSILTPSTSANYPSSTTASPAASVSSQPGIGSTTGSSGFLNWRTRSRSALQWVVANRLATLLGVLILLSLILYLLAALRRRSRTSTKAKRVTGSKVQPKVEPQRSLEAELDELLSGRSGTSAASSNLKNEFVESSAIAPGVVVVTPHNRNRVPSKPSIASSSAGRENSRDEEEREVFEL